MWGTGSNQNQSEVSNKKKIVGNSNDQIWRWVGQKSLSGVKDSRKFRRPLTWKKLLTTETHY